MTENNKTELEEGDDVSQLQLDDVQGGSRGSKKPRRASRPKVKTGCNNCKVRRVKCDETKPTCSKCRRSGRVCDGYPAYAERWKSENQMAAVSSSGLTEYSENSEPNVFIKLPSIKEHLSEFGFGEERYMLYDKSQSGEISPSQEAIYVVDKISLLVGSLQMIPGKSRSESSSGVYNAITPAENQRSPGPFRHEPSAGSEFQLYECRHLGCSKVFKFFHEFTRHVINCEYLEYGWQTEEELYRHRYFKHDGPVPFFECLFKPCKFKERRQDKCKDHMLKAHGWRGVWPKMHQESRDKRLLSEQLLLKQPRNSSGSSVDTDAVCEEGNMNPNTGLQTFAGGELSSSEQLAEARFERGPLYCPFPGCDYQSFGEEQ
ncbi:hypothetical protein OCU04_003189 [Sclerotinia nivalis]|uniref:Zn(2)-C6 fungal-type domain-containing protein n=1 Tax=Sclerotinia nivalis TaxID=352851 RepID=A0A9X0AV62_9HELO|nr:hypothetical protein OCU04_003189 [Sclerotinia nivalis]